MPAKSELYVADIALLRVIQEHPDSRKHDLWLPKGGGMWNKYLRTSGLVRLGRCTIVKSFDRYNDSIATLRFCNYLKNDVAHYQISDAGINLFRTLPLQPSKWPICVPLDSDGYRIWQQAEYYPSK